MLVEFGEQFLHLKVGYANMVNSILIFLSQWNQILCKLKVFSTCLCLSRLLFSLPLNNNISVNVISCVIIIFFSLLVTKIGNYTINTLLAVCSKLTYSILIDTICYGVFPQVRLSYSFFGYILSGIIFNAKSILVNTFIMLLILLFSNCIQIKNYIANKICKFNSTKTLKNFKTLSAGAL